MGSEVRGPPEFDKLCMQFTHKNGDTGPSGREIVHAVGFSIRSGHPDASGDAADRSAFAPGQRLTELDLVGRLKASRTPIRHALTRLAHEGLLEQVHSGGYRVRAFAIED